MPQISVAFGYNDSIAYEEVPVIPTKFQPFTRDTGLFGAQSGTVPKMVIDAEVLDRTQKALPVSQTLIFGKYL